MRVVYNVKINKSKAKVMNCDKEGQVQIRINVYREFLKQVNLFTYLERKITRNSWSKVEVGRIAGAKSTFNKNKMILSSKSTLKLGNIF